MLNIPDEYTAYCFDEACTYIQARLENDEKPYFKKRDTNVKQQHFSSASKLYESMGYYNGAYSKIIDT